MEDFNNFSPRTAGSDLSRLKKLSFYAYFSYFEVICLVKIIYSLF